MDFLARRFFLDKRCWVVLSFARKRFLRLTERCGAPQCRAAGMSMPTVWAALRNCCAKLSFLLSRRMSDETDIEIAQEATMKPITRDRRPAGSGRRGRDPYGRYKAKINHRLIHKGEKQAS